jgi:hypothetical protein
VAVNGTTQIRAGVIRPSWLFRSQRAGTGERAAGAGSILTIGAPVRVIRDPYFGILGTVSALPPEPHVLASGSRARVLEVTFESGEGVIIPRANVEIIEEYGWRRVHAAGAGVASFLATAVPASAQERLPERVV